MSDSKNKKVSNDTDSFSKMTKSLNQSGAFLQMHICNELKKRQWEYHVEYPVRVSPFIKDPNKDSTVITKTREYGHMPSSDYLRLITDCRNISEVKETSIDIVGRKKINEVMVTLLIESKKLNPDYVDWCFFQQKNIRDIIHIISKSPSNSYINMLFSVPGDEIYPRSTDLTLEQFTGWIPGKKPIADFGISLKNKEVQGEYYKSEKSIVDDSARQIIEGTYGFIVESMVQELVAKTRYYSSCHREMFLPIVVTNANLFLCHIHSDDIDPKTGQVTSTPDYERIESVIYECAAPKNVQFPGILSSINDTQNRIYVTKWDVLIMTPNAFSEFLDSLEAPWHKTKVDLA